MSVFCRALISRWAFATAISLQALPASADTTPTTIDFGARDVGEQVVLQSQYKNILTVPVRIGKLAATCGCTATRISQYTLKPGEMTELTIQVDSRSKPGLFATRAILLSADSEVLAEYVIRGQFTSKQRNLVCYPAAVISLGEQQAGDKAFRTLRIRRADATDVGILNVRCSVPWISAAMNRDSGTDPELQVRTVWPATRPSEHEYVVVDGGGSGDAVRIPVVGVSATSARAQPDRILVIPGRTEYSLLVPRQGARVPQLLGFEAKCDGLRVSECRGVAEEGGLRVRLRIHTQRNGYVHGVVSLSLLGSSSDIDVEVVGMVQDAE